MNPSDDMNLDNNMNNNPLSLELLGEVSTFVPSTTTTTATEAHANSIY